MLVRMTLLRLRNSRPCTLLSRGGFAVILAFFLRIRAEAYMDATGNRFNAVDLVWEFTFYIAVFATILAAPMT